MNTGKIGEYKFFSQVAAFNYKYQLGDRLHFSIILFRGRTRNFTYLYSQVKKLLKTFWGVSICLYVLKNVAQKLLLPKPLLGCNATGTELYSNPTNKIYENV